MNIDIKQATIENSQAISILTSELGYSAKESETKKWLSHLLNSNNHGVFVASNEDGGLCGWIVVEKRIFLESGCKAEITGLVVSSLFRRHGVGEKLVLAAEHWAGKMGLLNLVVRSNIQRKEAHEFYQNIGFSFKKNSASL